MKKARRKGIARTQLLLVAVMASLLLSGCGSVKIVRVPIPIPTFGFFGGESRDTGTEPRITQRRGSQTHQGVQYDAEGIASWYGNEFHGRTTASGERFNQNDLTAAHPNLPFGSRVRVTNVENGRRVIVRINDRGPFADRERIIDVSRAAARRLDFEHQGLTRVQLEVL